jgi:hypothetical protein
VEHHHNTQFIILNSEEEDAEHLEYQRTPDVERFFQGRVK